MKHFQHNSFFRKYWWFMVFMGLSVLFLTTFSPSAQAFDPDAILRGMSIKSFEAAPIELNASPSKLQPFSLQMTPLTSDLQKAVVQPASLDPLSLQAQKIQQGQYSIVSIKSEKLSKPVPFSTSTISNDVINRPLPETVSVPLQDKAIFSCNDCRVLGFSETQQALQADVPDTLTQLKISFPTALTTPEMRSILAPYEANMKIEYFVYRWGEHK